MNDIDWEFVGQTLRAGQYNLLLGAGVSLDSFSHDGLKNLLSAGGLRDALAVAMPRVRPNSSLNRLYRTASQNGVVDDLITSRFKNCIAGETVKMITQFRWRRIFTLNIDDALEAAYALKLDGQRPKIFNFNEPFEELRDRSSVPIIHLHGFAPRSEDGYVFDIKEYSGSVAGMNIWAHNLSHFIRSEPFFVMGTSLEEPDLAYFLSDRFNVRKRSDRAPSIFVEPFPDEATEHDCKEYKTELYAGFALDFLKELDTLLPDRSSISDDLLSGFSQINVDGVDLKTLAEFQADYERVPSSVDLDRSSGANFALGHRISWSDLKNDLDLPRHITAGLQKKLVEKRPAGFNLIVGPAGAGKTTVLRRLAYNLSQAGEICFWHRSIGKIRIENVKIISELVDRTIYIFIDNFADEVLDYSAMLTEMAPGKVVIVGAERWYRLDHVKSVVGEALLDEHRLDEVGFSLAKTLVQRYEELGLVPASSGVEYTYPIMNDPIAIACCRIMHDFKPLAEIIRTSLGHASSVQVGCYIFAALASYCVRTGVEYSIISKEYPNYLVDKMADEMLPLPLAFREQSEVEFITPLNEAFSDNILRSWAQDNPQEMLNIFLKLSKSVRPRVSLRAIIAGEPNSKLASRLFDYDEVVKPLIGMKFAQDFYDQTKSGWEWNSRYWHQVSQLKMDLAAEELDLKLRSLLAEQSVHHARFAESIEPHHQFTFTMIGHMLFRKSDVLNKIDAYDFKEAVDALTKAADIEKRKDRVTIHPFMILFKGVVSSLDRGAILSADQRSVIGSQIRRSSREFPRDRVLKTIASELKAKM